MEVGRAGEVSEFMDAALSTTEDGGPVSDKVTSHSYEMMYGTFLLPLRDRMARQGQNLKFLEISGDCDARGKPGSQYNLVEQATSKGRTLGELRECAAAGDQGYASQHTNRRPGGRADGGKLGAPVGR